MAPPEKLFDEQQDLFARIAEQKGKLEQRTPDKLTEAVLKKHAKDATSLWELFLKNHDQIKNKGVKLPENYLETFENGGKIIEYIIAFVDEWFFNSKPNDHVTPKPGVNKEGQGTSQSTLNTGATPGKQNANKSTGNEGSMENNVHITLNDDIAENNGDDPQYKGRKEKDAELNNSSSINSNNLTEVLSTTIFSSSSHTPVNVKACIHKTQPNPNSPRFWK